MSPGVLRKQAYLIWAEKTITPATLWASLPLSFSLLSFLFLPKVIPEIERKRLFAITSSSLNFRDDSCFRCRAHSPALPACPVLPTTLSPVVQLTGVNYDGIVQI